MRHNQTWLRSDLTYCASTARPLTPYAGQNILETDTGNVLYWYPISSGALPASRVLTEPFNDFTTNAWTTFGPPSIVAGRTGNCAQGTSGSVVLRKPLAAGDQTDTLTIGFAFRITGAYPSSIQNFCAFSSDSGATQHGNIRLHTDGTLSVARAAVQLAATAAGVIQLGIWYYIELSMKLSDTVGTVVLNVNGVNQLSLTAQDTKNAGTKTVYDQLDLTCMTGSTTTQFDDLYLNKDSTLSGDPTSVGVSGWYPPWNTAWGRVGYAPGLADVVTYPNADLGSVTFNAIKNRHYKYSYYTPKQDVNAASITYSLTDGGNAVVNGYAGLSVAYAAAVSSVAIMFEEPYVASSGSITRKIRAAISTASGTHTNSAKMFMLAEDIGPIGPPA